MKNRRTIVIIAYIAILVLAFSWMMGLFSLDGQDLTYSEIISLFNAKQVKSFTVVGEEIHLELYTPIDGETSFSGSISDQNRFRAEMWETIQSQADEGVIQTYDFLPGEGFNPFDLVLPLILVGLVLLIVWGFLVGRANAQNNPTSFGKARFGLHKGTTVTFADVAGADEEKTELQEVVDFLRNPDKYRNMGAKIPHGILLSGSPGTGKTLLARAVAGEANVPFFTVSGSDFVEMFVGVGASRVRDLFDQAKKAAPAIIFIDEIDAVGRKRGSGLGGGHDEREQTLNQILVEMDGFTKNEGVIVLAATNRPDILDPALLRPGRFDRQIYVPAPDAKGREAILKIHAKNKKLDGTVELRTIALATSGFTGADLSNLMNEAAILAARENRQVITMSDMNEAMMKVMAGPEKRSRMRLKKDQKITAYHEAGHAVAMYFLPTHDPVHQITIIPRGRSLGATWYLPKEESDHLTRNEMYEQIVGLLGGRVAEAICIGDISTGASNDIDRASKLARDMVARYGMCENLGTISYNGGDELFIGRDFEKTKSYSEKVAGTIDDEVKILMDKAYDHCRTILTDNREKLEAVVAFLMEKETMTGNQFKDCMEGKSIGEAEENPLFAGIHESTEE